MPLVRIDLPAGRSPEYRKGVADVLYEAMMATLDVPEADRFQVLSERAPGDLLIDPGYLGIARGPDALIVQVTLNRGRSREKKQAFYRAVAEGLQSRVGQRPEDVVINLVEVAPEDCSFGNGVAQYV
jgi:4-oxalocrotonate tautomerase